MRWDRLFADLEAQLAHEEAHARDAEVAERVRAEWARTRLADRVAGVVGRGVLGLRVQGLGPITGRVVDLGADWLLVREEARPEAGVGARGSSPAAGVDRESLVPLAAVLDVRGLPRASDPRPGVSMRRFGLGTALRALSRDRASVRVIDRTGAAFVGTVDRVGGDHLDLAEHAVGSARRDREVYGVRTLRVDALACLSRSGR